MSKDTKVMIDELMQLRDYQPSNLRSRYSREDDEFITQDELIKEREKFITADGNEVPIIQNQVEQELYFKRYTEERVHKYTQSELIAIQNGCVNTIVHDYGEFDWYHSSDEDRVKYDQLSEIRLKLSSIKSVYGHVDQYIRAMRIVYEAWLILGKNTYIHDIDEFFELVSEGRITSNRILMPKLRRMDKYNIDILIKYISDTSLDPTVLVPAAMKRRDQYDEFFGNKKQKTESKEDKIYRLLSLNEIKSIQENMKTNEPMEVRPLKSKYISGYDRRNFKRKGESKKDRNTRESVAEILNKIQSSNYSRDREGASYMVTHSLFEVPKKGKSFFDDIHFDGSWANNDEVKLYDLAIQEEMRKQKVGRDSYLTHSDRELDKFFKTLEANGINVLELRRQIGVMEMSDRKVKFNRRKNRQLESTIIQRISKLNKNEKFLKIVKKAEKVLTDQQTMDDEEREKLYGSRN